MNNDKLFFDLPKSKPSPIKVIGVGGGGNNAVKYMYNQGIIGVDFIICNTDAQALNNNPVPTKIQLGTTITEGLGAGANPEIGEQAAIENIDEIKSALGENTKMLFITAGMGGGTGTGAAPIIAGCARDMGILTVGIVTIPFSFEGRSRLDQAHKGLEKFRKNVDSLIVIDNDKLRELFGNLGYKSGFAKADEILSTAAKGIAEVITQNYTVNIDLRDAKTVLANSGTAIMGSARATGQTKAQDAIKSALDSPLLNDNKITGAKNVLLLIVSGNDEITIDEIGIINDYIQDEAGNGTNIIMGIGEDESLEDSISVTIIATGFAPDDEKNNGKQKIYHTLKDENSAPKIIPTIETEQTKTVKPTEIHQKILSIAPSFEKPKIIRSIDIEPDNIDNILDDIKIIHKSDISEDYSEKDESPTESKKTFILDDFEEEKTSYGISNKNIIQNKIPEEPKSTESSNSINNKIDTKKFIDPMITEEEKEKAIEIKFNTPDIADSSINKISIDRIPPTEKVNFFEKPNLTEKVVEILKTPKTIEEQPISKIITLDDSSELFNDNISFSKQENKISQLEREREPIDVEISKKIQDRRNRLKLMNSKYQGLVKQNIDEIEKIPAYKRQGINLDENYNDNSSSGSLSINKTNKIEIKPNSFFHDNVD